MGKIHFSLTLAQISRRFLDKRVKERMLEIFWSCFLRISNKDKAITFLNDLLSPVEVTMLSKRLAIAFLLSKGYSYEEIEELVKVSNTTVTKVKAILENGQGYKAIIDQIIKEEKWGKFWNDLEEVIEKILPPTPGTNWKEVRRRQWEERRRGQKPF